MHFPTGFNSQWKQRGCRRRVGGLGKSISQTPLSPCHTGLSNQRRAPPRRTSNRLFYSAIAVFKKKKCWRDWRTLAAQPKFHRARHQIRRVPLDPMAGGGNGDQREIFVQHSHVSLSAPGSSAESFRPWN